MMTLPISQPLTDAEWKALEPLFPEQEKRTKGKPHAPWRDVVNSILFVLKGHKWSSVPSERNYAPKTTANSWYKEWKQDGKIEQILGTLGITDAVHPPARDRIQAIAFKELRIKPQVTDNKEVAG